MKRKANRQEHDLETVKIGVANKCRLNVEYKGQIASFGGDLCLGGFAAIANSMSWIRHIGPLREGEQQEVIRAVHEYSKRNKNFRIYFYDDKNNEIKF